MNQVTDQVSTLFVVKESEEFCFLFDPDDPAMLYDVLFAQPRETEWGLDRSDVFEVIEGMVPDRLRGI